MHWRNLWDHLAGGFDLDSEAMPGELLIELYGNKRVLIENHCGVLEYLTDRICVKVKNDQVCVTGQGLWLSLISKERLVICGRIDSVHLVERG